MRQKYQWILLAAVCTLKGTIISVSEYTPPPDMRSKWIFDYTYSCSNPSALVLIPPNVVKFGRTIEYPLLELLFLPNSWPDISSKIDIVDGFYCIQLRPEDTINLVLTFHMAINDDLLITLLIILPMGLS